MKQYGLIEPSIVECRRAKSYVMFHTIASIVFAVIALIAGIAAKNAGIAIALILIDAIQAGCYYLSVKTTVLGVTRHFVAGHVGVLFDRNFVTPMAKVVSIDRHSSFFERIFGATTIRVRTSGGMVCRFSGMDAASAAKMFQVFQKYVILAEQTQASQNPNA
ncbi:MAG: PH domain-containing protein [Clostridia bacterium]|nr:PH domain-containing protein [Clostridia bacterium]MBQ9995915.1 PH domain-containing protein [Clostridia bacterium]